MRTRDFSSCLNGNSLTRHNSTRRGVHLRSVSSYDSNLCTYPEPVGLGSQPSSKQSLLTRYLYVVACSQSAGENYSHLVEEVNKEYPNTKIIGYPYNYANEEATLGLIDDVLNAWGRYVDSTSVSSNMSPLSAHTV